MVVTMPSRYSSEGSIADSDILAKNLGVKLWNISIEDMFQSSLDSLDPLFAGTGSGVAEENLQARMRGNLLMAISNKFGWLVLTTGNKSEMAMGYGTLYGDMAGGFAVIKDVPKVLVYELAETRNARGASPVIPQSVIDKEPQRGAAPRPEGHRQPTSLQRSRPRAGGIRRAGQVSGGDHRHGVRGGDGQEGDQGG